MITDAILGILYAVVWVLITPLRILPDVSLSAEVVTTISSASGYLSSLDRLLPVSQLLIVTGLILGIEFIIFTYKLIMWAIKKIPTIN